MDKCGFWMLIIGMIAIIAGVSARIAGVPNGVSAPIAFGGFAVFGAGFVLTVTAFGRSVRWPPKA